MPAATAWRVNAEIKDAKRRKGVRGAVIVLGSECRASYLPEGCAESAFHVGAPVLAEFLRTTCLSSSSAPPPPQVT